MEPTIWCKCGKPYKFYNMYVGDQSVCPKCRAEAEKNMGSRYQLERKKEK